MEMSSSCLVVMPSDASIDADDPHHDPRQSSVTLPNVTAASSYGVISLVTNLLMSSVS